MKLAEALAERADLQKRLQQVTHRAQAAARYQEGSQPPEDVNELLAEGVRLADDIQSLVVRINATNSDTTIRLPKDWGSGRHAAQAEVTITAAIAIRDCLNMQRKLVTEVTEAAAGTRGIFGYRRTRTELVDQSDLNVAERRAEIDRYAKHHRELDVLIQQANWNTDLL